jgi:hypothetical protein
MSRYQNLKFSVTVHTDDRELIGCLSALAHCCQPENPRQILIEGQARGNWERNGNQATFHFSSEANRETFIDTAKVVYTHSWRVDDQRDNDPPHDAY